MKGRWILVAVCLTVSLSRAAYALSLDIVPFYGYRLGGGFEDDETGEDFDLSEGPCWGGMLDLYLSETTQVEFYYSHQETELESEGLFTAESLFDLDVDYYHFGGTYIILEGAWQPFVVATLGATHLSPGPSGADSLTRFSLGLGGGVRFFPTEHFGLYFAGRALYTFVESDTAIRVESGRATVNLSSDGLWQAELQAGLVFAF